MQTEKRPSDLRVRDWLLTVPADGDKGVSREELASALDSYSAYVGQLEKSETGYLHWQLYLSHAEPIRFQTLKRKLPTAHLEPRRGTPRQAVAYVTKQDTRVPGETPLVKGEINLKEAQGKRSDLDELREEILNGTDSLASVLASNTTAWRYSRHVRELIAARDALRWGTQNRDVQVKVFYGRTGTGKTSSVLASNLASDVCRVTGYGSGAFDGYSGHPVLALDEFRGQIPVSLLLTLCDPYPVKLPARYEDKQAAFSTLYLLSNVPPWEWYPGEPEEVKKALARRFSEVRCFTAPGKSRLVKPEKVLERMLDSKLAS